jgi:hypothetical protein
MKKHLKVALRSSGPAESAVELSRVTLDFRVQMKAGTASNANGKAERWRGRAALRCNSPQIAKALLNDDDERLRTNFPVFAG